MTKKKSATSQKIIKGSHKKIARKKTVKKLSKRTIALRKAELVLDKAKVDRKLGSLHKIEKSMEKTFGRKPHISLKPLGITFAEKLPRPRQETSATTGTGTVKCTWSPIKCGPDVDF